MSTLIVQHVADSNPPAFNVIREDDHKQAGPYEVPSPFEMPVKDKPASNLMRELPWYLERYLKRPRHPWTEQACNVIEALEEWGSDAYRSMFDNGTTGPWIATAKAEGYRHLKLIIKSDDPAMLQWPWQALRDPQAGYLSLSCRLERRLNETPELVKLSEELPHNRINILMVTARPYQNDVAYRTISRPLVELIEEEKIPARVHVLRPPTFDNLRAHLRDNRDYYHILHFDGHGAYGSEVQSEGGAGMFLAPPQGHLIFESEDGEGDPITADKLSELLRDCAVPVVVLNACQSASIDESAPDQFASVATGLLKAGIRSVVAMSYSLYVSAARQFLPAFYRELFKSGDISESARAGRQQMFSRKERISPAGDVELQDFIVPVVYQQEEVQLEFRGDGAAPYVREKAELPDEALLKKEDYPYGFIGRDRAILEIERALRRDCPAILVHGLGGVGKSSLARGLVNWLNDTGGLAGCHWLNFQDILSAEYVINHHGTRLLDEGYRLLSMEQRIEALANHLNESELILVWDNFEDVAGIEDTYITPRMKPEDRALLHKLLKKLWGGRSKVIITSRSEERWLEDVHYEVKIGGLRDEELWEYCEAILKNRGVKVERNDEQLLGILEELDGHPLGLEAVLPLLKRMSAGSVLSALKTNQQALGPAAEKLHGGIRLAVSQLPDEMQEVLIPLGLHERFIDLDGLGLMAKQVDEKLTPGKLESCFQLIEVSGLIAHIGNNIYRLHPALTGYLRTHVLEKANADRLEAWQRAFVDFMAAFADHLAPKELHEQRFLFEVHGASFHQALALATLLGMNAHVGALTQSLAAYAQNCRNWIEAERLFQTLADHLEALGNEKGLAAAYHQLGRIAEEQRDFAGAEQWYLKSLAIEEKHGNEHGAAQTYHQLGIIAQKQRDYISAEQWYLKSLAIEEKQGNEHGAAITYGQLGIVAGLQGSFEQAAQWLVKCVAAFRRTNDPTGVARNTRNFMLIYRAAPDEFKPAMQRIWEQGGLGPLPDLPEE